MSLLSSPQKTIGFVRFLTPPAAGPAEKSLRHLATAFVATCSLLITLLSNAAPRPIDSTQAEAPEGAKVEGLGSVSLLTGDFTYSYPIRVPPGRGGFAPTLALAYNSSGPIYGTVAQGWELPLPAISKDVSSSQLGIVNFPGFRVGDTRLVELSAELEEPMPPLAQKAFRAEHDADQARYFKMGQQSEFEWLVLYSDGSRDHFGERSSYREIDPETGKPRDRVAPTDQMAPLFRSIDPYGNEIEYTVQWFEVDSFVLPGAGQPKGQRAVGHQLVTISYGANPRAGLGHHAKVQLRYNESNRDLDPSTMRCEGFGPHIGTKMSYRSGRLLASGANWLTSIQTLADRNGDGNIQAEELVKKYELIYNLAAARCDAGYAPRRQLGWVQESSYSVDNSQVATLPAVRFLYGDLDPPFSERTLAPSVPLDMAFATYSHSYAYNGYGNDLHPLTQLRDMDGDGLLDLLAIDPRPADDTDLVDHVCSGYWLRNVGGDFADPDEAVQFTLPTIEWGDWGYTGQRYCDLSGQKAGTVVVQVPDAPSEVRERFLDYVWDDYDGDGDTDLLVGGRYIDFQDFEAMFPPIATENGSDLIVGAYFYPPDLLDENLEYHGDPPAHRGFREGLGYKQYVFENEHGTLASRPISKLQPAPLVGDGSTFIQNRELMGYLDVNGDGITDYVTYDLRKILDDHLDYDVEQWVLFGDGHGNFKADRNGEAHRFYQAAGPIGPDACARGPAAGYRKCRYMGLFSGAGLTMPPVDVEDSEELTRVRTLSASPHGRYDLNGDGLADMLSAQAWWMYNGEMRANEEATDWGVPTWALNNGRFYDEAPTSADWRNISAGGRTLASDQADFNFVDLTGTRSYSLIDLSYGVARTQYHDGGMNYLETGRSYKEMRLLDVDGDGLLDRVYVNYDGQAGTAAPWEFSGMTKFESRLKPGDYAKLFTAPSGPLPDRFLVALNYMGVGFLPPRAIRSSEAGKIAAALAQIQDVARYDITFTGLDLPYLPVAEAGFSFSGVWRKESIGLTLDLDGDGYSEMITRQPGAAEYSVLSRDFQDPPGLLTRIVHSGGRFSAETPDRNGGYTDIDYRSIFDQSIVEHDRAAGKVPRSSRFVVHTLQHVPGVYTGHNPPKMAEVFHYIHPVWNRDLQGRWGFRGYEKVQRRHHIYYGLEGWTNIEETVKAYDLDYRGLVVETSVRNDLGQHLAKGTTTWQELPLAGDPALSIFVPRYHSGYSCSGNETDWANDCLHSQNELLYQTLHSLPLAGDLVPVVVEKAEGLAYDTAYAAEHGNRRTSTRYGLRYGADEYRKVVTASDIRAMEVVAGCDPQAGACALEEILVGQQEIMWSTDLLSVEQKRTRAEEGGPWIADRQTTDPLTGLVTATQSPEEAAKGSTVGAWSRVVYDPLQLYAVEAIDELGHKIRVTDYDYGLGLALATEGPGFKCPGYASNSTDIDCPEGERVYATNRMVVDPHGRVLEEWVSFDGAYNAVPYTLRKVKRYEYFDQAFQISGEPLAIHQYSWLRGTEWTRSDTLLDIFKRPLQTVAYNAETGDRMRKYTYDGSGQVVELETNDPSAAPGSSARVRYRFQYDVFGRQVGARLPDPATGEPGDTGFATVFPRAGVLETRELTTDGGPAASKIQRFDRHGRLVEVSERQSSGAGHPRTARYDYAGTGFLRRIVDGDGVTTEVEHNWQGLRTAVHRADKTWSYRYDRNGNVTDLVMPRPADSAEEDYTKHLDYDELGRLVRVTPAPASLTAQQRQDWLIGATVLRYDLDTNVPGALGEIDGPVAITSHTYDALGRSRTSTQQLKVPGLQNDPLGTRVDYDGYLIDAVWTADRDTATTRYPRLVMRYDPAGNPTELEHQLMDTSNASLEVTQLGKVYRNAAGLVLQRQSAHASPSVPFDQAPVQASWSYDKQGRLLDLGAGVLAPGIPSLQEKVRYQATYFDSGEPSTLSQMFDGVGAQFSFTYDDRHMLTTASTAGAGYAATFGYTAGGRMASADVTLPPSAVLGSSRQVDYRYNTDDPSELGSLARSDGTGDFASYRYDPAGNMLEREAPGASWHTFAYDGDNRLREAVDVTTGGREVYYYHQNNRVAAVQYDPSGAKVSSRRWFGETEVRYDAGDHRQETLQRAGLGQTLARITDGERVDFIVLSPQSHTLLAMDSSGQVNGGAIYGPFGEILHKAGSLESYRRGFNEKDFDPSSGLSYYGFRYYDPVGLIWNRPDPLYSAIPDRQASKPTEAHLYTFSGNNPMTLVDPDGRSPGTRGVHLMMYDEDTVRGLQERAAAAEAHFMGGPQYDLNDVIRQAARGVGVLKVVGGGAMMAAGGTLMVAGAETLNPGVAGFGVFVFAVGSIEVATGTAQAISAEWLGDTITKAATEVTGSDAAGIIIGKAVRWPAKIATGAGAMAVELGVSVGEVGGIMGYIYYSELGEKIDSQGGVPYLADIRDLITPILKLHKSWAGQMARPVTDSFFARGFTYTKDGVVYDFKGFNALSEREHALVELACGCEVPRTSKNKKDLGFKNLFTWSVTESE